MKSFAEAVFIETQLQSLAVSELADLVLQNWVVSWGDVQAKLSAVEASYLRQALVCVTGVYNYNPVGVVSGLCLSKNSQDKLWSNKSFLAVSLYSWTKTNPLCYLLLH